jgi:hypothetical protein
MPDSSAGERVRVRGNVTYRHLQVMPRHSVAGSSTLPFYYKVPFVFFKTILFFPRSIQKVLER